MTTTLESGVAGQLEPGEPHPRWPLTQPGFWKDGTLARRQQKLHCAAALAAPTLIVVLPARHQGWAWAWWLVLIVAGAILGAAAVLVAFPMAERNQVTLAHGGRPPGRMADRWCGAVVVAAGLTLVAGGVSSRSAGSARGSTRAAAAL